MAEELEKAEEALRAAESQFSAAAEEMGKAGAQNWNSETALIAASLTLGLALIAFSAMTWLILKSRSSPMTLMRTFTVPLVCVMAVLLVILGYSEQQIAPVIGLLGTVVGYLLGKRETTDRSNDKVSRETDD